MKDYEDEAFDDIERAQQRKVATGVTDGTIYFKNQFAFTPNQIAFTPNPVPIGAWVLYAGAPSTIKFMMYAKPTDEQIKNTEALLGWKWEDV